MERTQKTFAKLVLREKYKNYEDALLNLNLDSLEVRRRNLCLKFAQTGIKHKTLDDLFPINEKLHSMKTRDENKYKVNFANTNRFKNSSIITMQNMLNANEKENNPL